MIALMARLGACGLPSVSEVVKSTFMEFKRTHMDEWHQHREAFDADTLSAFNDCFDAPTYFV